MSVKKINWMGYEWECSQRWGSIHPNGPIEHYDGDMVSINSDGHLVLSARYDPRTFVIDGKKIVSDYAVGLVNCTNPFGYGVYQIEAKLPQGHHLWPAFWMWSFGDKYAEIDVFEGYTNSIGSYLRLNWKNLFGFWKVMTNVYWGRDAAHHLGESTKFFGFKNPSKNFIKYRLLWEKDLIKIWYGDTVIREITDKAILDKIKGVDMNVILNLSVRDEANFDSVEEPFIIKSFKYNRYGR